MGLPDPVVCIVGAGPAGLVTAHLLHQAGISVVLLERQQADQLRARVKAGMIEHRTVELLRRHDLAGPILSRGMRAGQCEFRADGQAFRLDYAARCGGRGHYIYPQHELVADWAGELVALGGDLRFGVLVTSIDQDADGAMVRAAGPVGEPVTIECAAVVAGDGAGSVAAANMTAFTATYPTRWLTLIAAVPPLTDGNIYGLHEDGFAGQMPRAANLSRFMLEVPGGQDFQQWDDGRIWAELARRLTAAHLITPAGGKGMNIAIQDAAELSGGLIERYGSRRDGGRLDRYTQTRLPHIWRHQEFSNLMLTLFNAGAGGSSGFGYGLRRARLDLVLNNPQFARWFAHTYVGVDE